MEKPKRPKKSINIYYFLPIILFRFLFDKLFNTVTNLSTRSNIISGKYYYSKSFGLPNDLNYLHKVPIKYITNRKLRYSLYLTSLFKPWYVYIVEYATEQLNEWNKRQRIYISRDNIQKGDSVVGERINNVELNKLFKNKYQKKRKEMGIRSPMDYHKLDFQYYIICSKYTNLHKDLKKYSRENYKYRKKVELKKAVEKAIKTSNFNTGESFLCKKLGASLIEHLLYYKEYEYLDKIFNSLDHLDKEYFIQLLEEFLYVEIIDDDRKEYVSKLKEYV